MPAFPVRRYRLCEAFRSHIGAEYAEPELFELEALVREYKATAAAAAAARTAMDLQPLAPRPPLSETLTQLS